jgi:hypothetical protein
MNDLGIKSIFMQGFKRFMARLMLVASVLLMGWLCVYSVQGQMVGFNHGQIHHELQKKFGMNGRAPQEWIDSMVKATPKGMLEVGRMSGTMSNNWTLDLPGYNFLPHTAQLDKRIGGKELIWTLNTHQAYIARKEGRLDDAILWEKRMWEALNYVRASGIKIVAIHLDNEWWMDYRVCGVSSGSMNAGDKFRYAGGSGLFKTNAYFEPMIRSDMQAFCNYLAPIADSCRKLVKGVKILMTVDQTSHLRGRIMWDVVKNYTFYDGITPHLYLKANSYAELQTVINNRLAPFKGYDIWVTECNYYYGQNDSGTTWPSYVQSKFRFDMIDILKKNRDVKAVMYHTWWMGVSSYGWLKEK